MAVNEGLEKSDIERLIAAEIKTIKSLRCLKNRIKKKHKDYSIAKTVGSSTAIAGTVSTLIGVFLAPVTAGLSLGLTAGGIAGSILGGGTTLTTGFIESAKTKKWADELQEALKERERELQRIGDKIVTYHAWKEYVKHAALGTTYVCVQGAAALRLGKIVKYLTITAPEYGLNTLSTTSLVANQLPCSFLLDANNLLTKNLTKMGINTAKVGVSGLRILAVGIGVVGIGIDVYTIVDTWAKDPKLASQIDKICEHLEESKSLLTDLKNEFD